MIRGLIFLFLLLAFVCLAIKKGNNDERRVALALLFASVSSLIAVIIEQKYFSGINITMFVVDTIFFLYLLYVTLFSKHYWPLWVSALQLINAVIHIVVLFTPQTLPQAYAFSQGLWSYVQILIVSLAIINRKQLETLNAGDPINERCSN